MGCNVSMFEMNGGGAFLKLLDPIKGRRLFRRPFKDSTLSKKELLSNEEDMKIFISSNPSNDAPYSSLEDIIKKSKPPKGIDPAELKIEPIKGVGIAIIIAGSNYGIMKVVTEEKSVVNGTNDDIMIKESPRAVVKATKEDTFVDDDDVDNGERMMGYGDGDACPGSPSFRVYYKENWEDGHNEIIDAVKNDDAFKETVSTGDIVPPKELSSHVEKNVKRERKKRCFRKVLPKRGQSAIKNILNVKSCCSSCHEHRHIN